MDINSIKVGGFQAFNRQLSTDERRTLTSNSNYEVQHRRFGAETADFSVIVVLADRRLFGIVIKWRLYLQQTAQEEFAAGVSRPREKTPRRLRCRVKFMEGYGTGVKSNFPPSRPLHGSLAGEPRQ